MPKIRGKYETKEKTIGEVNDLPSMTIEGQAWTIRELLKKHQAGVMPPGIDRSPIYGEDEPDFDSLDLQSANNLDLAEKTEQLQHIKDVVSLAESKVALATAEANAARQDSANVSAGDIKKANSDAPTTTVRGHREPEE